MTTISAGAASVREQSRRQDGKFGTQQHGVQDADLARAENGTCYDCGRELVVDGDERIHIGTGGVPFYPTDHVGVLESDLPELAPEALPSSDEADQAAAAAYLEHRVDSREVPDRPAGGPANFHDAEATWTIGDAGRVSDTFGRDVTSQAVVAIESETMRRAGGGLVRTPLGAYYDGDATQREAQDFLVSCDDEDAAIEACKAQVSEKSRDRHRDTPAHPRTRVRPGWNTHLGDGVWGTRCTDCLQLHVTPISGHNPSLQEHRQNEHGDQVQPLLPSRIRMQTAAKAREDAAASLPRVSREDQIRKALPNAIVAPGLDYKLDGLPVTTETDATGKVVALTRGKTRFEVPRSSKDVSHSPGGNAYKGDRASEKYVPLTERAKSIRTDIKAAVEVGWLPSNLAYRVKTGSGSSISVDVDGWSDTDRMDPEKVKIREQDPSWYQRTESQEFFDLSRRIDAIRGRYGRHDTDSMTDYFGSDYYGSVNIRTEAQTAFGERERAAAKARREELAAARANRTA